MNRHRVIFPGVLTLALVLVLVLVLDSCDSQSQKPVETAPAAAKQKGGSQPVEPVQPAAEPTGRKLVNAQDSLEAVAREALRAVRAGDLDRLRALRVSREEYLELLFPEFDVARRPKNTVPPEFHWGLLDSKSEKGALDAVHEYARMRLELIEAYSSEGVKQFDTYRLHKKVRLKVRRLDDGQEADIAVFGSVVEMDGKFKILSYPS